MPTPATPPWQQQVHTVRTHMETLCTGLADAPVHERLETLRLLQDTFHDLHDEALIAAATAARGAGWGLRRIGTAIGRSHEQVRKMTTSPALSPQPRPAGVAAVKL